MKISIHIVLFLVIFFLSQEIYSKDMIEEQLLTNKDSCTILVDTTFICNNNTYRLILGKKPLTLKIDGENDNELISWFFKNGEIMLNRVFNKFDFGIKDTIFLQKAIIYRAWLDENQCNKEALLISLNICVPDSDNAIFMIITIKYNGVLSINEDDIQWEE